MGKRLADESFWSVAGKAFGLWGAIVVVGCLAVVVAAVLAILFVVFVLPLLL